MDRSTFDANREQRQLALRWLAISGAALLLGVMAAIGFSPLQIALVALLGPTTAGGYLLGSSVWAALKQTLLNTGAPDADAEAAASLLAFLTAITGVVALAAAQLLVAALGRAAGLGG